MDDLVTSRTFYDYATHHKVAVNVDVGLEGEDNVLYIPNMVYIHVKKNKQIKIRKNHF
jgi:hypothetical protein